VSKVEYNKMSGGRPIALVHCGSDLFVRTVWSPINWAIRVKSIILGHLLNFLEITVLDSNGDIKKGEKIRQDIAGPCCHGGRFCAIFFYCIEMFLQVMLLHTTGNCL
jgi:diaminopimelate decarboxylase